MKPFKLFRLLLEQLQWNSSEPGGFQCLAQGHLHSAKTCCDLQDTVDTVVPILCTQVQPEAEVSSTWSLSPLYLFPTVIMYLNNRLKRTGMVKDQGFFSDVITAH